MYRQSDSWEDRLTHFLNFPCGDSLRAHSRLRPEDEQQRQRGGPAPRARATVHHLEGRTWKGLSSTWPTAPCSWASWAMVGQSGVLYLSLPGHRAICAVCHGAGSVPMSWDIVL